MFPGAMRLSAPAGALENSIRPTAAGCHLASSFCGSVAENKLHRIPFGYFVIRRNRRKSGIDRRTGKEAAVTVPEMVELLNEEGEEWAYQTVATFLKRLEGKKVLGSR